jgi:hypothetical protein
MSFQRLGVKAFIAVHFKGKGARTEKTKSGNVYK